MIETYLTEAFGRLGTQLKQTEDRLIARLDSIDEQMDRRASLTRTLIEMLTKQTGWHEQSDNAVADLAARHAEFGRRLDELRGKQ